MVAGLVKVLIEHREKEMIHVTEWIVPNYKGLTKQHVARGFHEGFTSWLTGRLEATVRNEAQIQPHYHYKTQRGGCLLEGEMDVLRLTPRRSSDGRYFADYFEVKSYYNPEARRRAVEQFRRANEAHPQWHWRYVLVTPERIERFYRKDLRR